MIELPILMILGIGAAWFFLTERWATNQEIARRQKSEKEARIKAIRYMIEYAKRERRKARR